jgi:hypothetical protein
MINKIVIYLSNIINEYINVNKINNIEFINYFFNNIYLSIIILYFIINYFYNYMNKLLLN